MSRSFRKSLDLGTSKFTLVHHCRHEIGSGKDGFVRSGRSMPLESGYRVMSQKPTIQSFQPSNPPDNTVKGGVADEESFFKRSLQSTLTVNDLQVQSSTEMRFKGIVD